MLLHLVCFKYKSDVAAKQEYVNRLKTTEPPPTRRGSSNPAPRMRERIRSSALSWSSGRERSHRPMR